MAGKVGDMKTLRKLFAAICLSIPCLAMADCFDDAGVRYQVNPWILRGIAHVESGFNSKAVNHNRNGSYDLGMMQTNTIHLRRLARYGISRDHLFNACNSIHIAAWMVREKMNLHGNTWKAVGAYHSETPFYRDRYAAKVRSTIVRWSKFYQMN